MRRTRPDGHPSRRRVTGGSGPSRARCVRGGANSRDCGLCPQCLDLPPATSYPTAPSNGPSEDFFRLRRRDIVQNVSEVWPARRERSHDAGSAEPADRLRSPEKRPAATTRKQASPTWVGMSASGRVRSRPSCCPARWAGGSTDQLGSGPWIMLVGGLLGFVAGPAAPDAVGESARALLGRCSVVLIVVQASRLHVQAGCLHHKVRPEAPPT
jgi:hypothetical protein